MDRTVSATVIRMAKTDAALTEYTGTTFQTFTCVNILLTKINSLHMST